MTLRQTKKLCGQLVMVIGCFAILVVSVWGIGKQVCLGEELVRVRDEIVVQERRQRSARAEIYVPELEPSKDLGLLKAKKSNSTEKVEFINGDVVSAFVRHLNEKKELVADAPLFTETITIPVENVKKISSPPPSQALPVANDEVILTNGDVISGDVALIDSQNIVLETGYAGELKIRRAMAKCILFGIAGRYVLSDDFETDADNWQPHGGSWNMDNGRYVQTQHTTCYATAEVQQEGPMEYEWTMAANEGDYIRGYFGFFCTDTNNRWGGNSYQIYVNRTSVYCYRVQNNSTNQIGHTNLNQQTAVMKCKASYDPETGTIQLWINGTSVGTWTDSSGCWQQGRGVHLVARRALSFDDVVITRGEAISRSLLKTAKEVDVVVFANKDKASGEVVSLEKSNLSLKADFGSISISVGRLGAVVFNADKREVQRKREGDVQVHIHNRNRVTLELKELNPDQLCGYSDSLGQVALDRQAIKSIVFWLYE